MRVRWQVIPLAILVVVAVSFVVLEVFGLLSFGGSVEGLREADRTAAAGGIFALLVADGLLPVPSTALMVVAGTILGIPVGTVLVVAGSMVSSVAVYAIGRLANPWLRRRVIVPAEMEQMQRWADRFGPWLFVLARGVPMMAETVGASAGIARVPLGRFLGYTLLGTVPICLLYVVAGAYAETAEQIVMILVIGFLAALLLWYGLRKVMTWRERG